MAHPDYRPRRMRHDEFSRRLMRETVSYTHLTLPTNREV